MADQSLPSPQKSPQTAKASETSVSPTTWQKISKVFGWPFWTVVVMISFGVTGYAATSALLNLNSPKGCESVYWPLASGARRLYCAQVKAQEGDADSLLAAISLVSGLPEDHPLRQEINKNIKIWSEEVLSLGEKHFQAGNMETALEIAEKIPSSVAAKEVIEEKTQRWREIWEKGEAIEQDVEEQLRQAAWNLAFKEAGRLVDLKNEYLANRRYTELVAKIQQAKIEGAALEEAWAAFDRGGVENLLTAIEKARSIEQDSYSYQAAQNLIEKVGKTLMAKAQQNLDRRNWQTVLDIAQAIPESLGLEEEVSDLKQISFAGLQAQMGTVAGLEDAIAQAEQLEKERPLYQQAQSLISRWEREIEDVKVLNVAQRYARQGTVTDLRAAMIKAEEVPRGNPRYQQAQNLISQWNRQIQTIEDRPILNRATEIARGRSISDYQSAIAVASQISSNRALYQQAQAKIANWRDRIERRQDQPILTAATRLANQGRMEAAIEKAQQISRNRVLYQQAQAKIRRWRQDLTARESISEATQLAEAQTPEALNRAIQTIIPALNSGNYRYRAERLIDQWSKQIYAIALRQADENQISTAIRIARQVPSQSSVYQEVRGRIQGWEAELTSTSED
jgi:hypothetical protein